MIKPTIGRRVWFFPASETYMSIYDHAVPCDAGVVYVWGDRMVNLDVCDHSGHHWAVHSVKLLQDDDAVPTGEAYAMWMPYQTGQAKAAA